MNQSTLLLLESYAFKFKMLCLILAIAEPRFIFGAILFIVIEEVIFHYLMKDSMFEISSISMAITSCLVAAAFNLQLAPLVAIIYIANEIYHIVKDIRSYEQVFQNR